MPAPVRPNFSSQTTPEVLPAPHQISEAEGRQFQSVMDEALRDCNERNEKGRPCNRVAEAFVQSLQEFDSLYREFAK